MKKIKTYLYWLFVIVVSFLTHSTDSRYLKSEKTENELSNQGTISTISDEDIDLETFLNDYYDDLWLQIKATNVNLDKSKEEEKEDGNKKSLADYDYMSDMAVAEPEIHEEKLKSLGSNPTEEDRENFTWPFGNTPAFNASSSDDGVPEALRAYRQRKKEMRIKLIKDQVLRFRGGTPKSNESIPDVKQFKDLKQFIKVYEKNFRKIQSDEWTSSYTEKVQSFYPSCEKPRNTDEDVWSDPLSMNLLFDLDYPSPQEDSTVMIVSAKLRLYKLAQENYSSSNMEAGQVKPEKTQNSFGVPTNDDDDQVRISVYWYTRSLRRQRVKKKLLDSQMISISASKWIEFNIRPAVRTWKESGRNFGLVVNVEDEDGDLLPVEQYIHSMNCSKWSANVRPIPSIVMDRISQFFIENMTENRNETFAEEIKNEEDKTRAYLYQTLFYPIIDLCTREVPNSDVKSLALVNSAKKALETKFLNFSRNGFNIGNENISVLLKKNNVDMRDVSKTPRSDKSVFRKSEARVSNFKIVPIGSPSSNQNGEPQPSKKSRGTPDDEVNFRPESSGSKNDRQQAEDRERPRIRHNRKQWDMLQKSANSDSRLTNDFNATDYH